MKVFLNVLIKDDDPGKGIDEIKDEALSALEENGINVIWHKASEPED